MTEEKAQQIIASWLASSKAPKGQLGYIEGWFDDDDVEAFRMAIEALKQKPVKHGKWIESKERSKHWYCSVCGCIHTDPETGKWRETFDYRYPFCPNCGADMRGEEE